MSNENTNTKPPVNEREAALKLEQLSVAVESAKLDLKKKRRDDKAAIEQGKLDLRTKRAAAEKAELDLQTARRVADREKSLDSENAEYMFCEGVSWDTVKSAIADLNKLSRRFPGQPLSVTLNSPGGSVIAGLALYDHIRELSARGHHMTVKVRGMAASMGGILLQAGDTRVIGAEAMILIHEVSSGTVGKVTEMEDSVAFSRALWDKLAKILARQSTMTAEEIQKKAYKFDWWIGAEEALKLGFADKIA
jgi:ATP-dependent Clp endopeptidase proteolytic subunit ClpP